MLPKICAAAILVCIAFFLAVPTANVEAWFGRRSVEPIQQVEKAPGGLIQTSKRTIANVEDITDAVKAGIAAAGDTIHAKETTRAAAGEQTLSVAVSATVQDARPPRQEPTHNSNVADKEPSSAIKEPRPSCPGGVCDKGSCGVKSLTRGLRWRR